MSKKILTIQDLSVVGQCSLGVALPVISALGVECCGLPSSVLSTHTAKPFGNFVSIDLTDKINSIANHYKELDIKFDGILTGYIANANQLSIIKKLIKDVKTEKAKIIIDPVLGDGGKPYKQMNEAMINAMRKFIKGADIILPNITEAYLLLGLDYKPCPLNDDIKELLIGLNKLSGGDVVLTGVNFIPGQIGVAYLHKNEVNYCFADKSEGTYHGAGDILSSIIAATLTQGFTLENVLPEAVDYISECIKGTDLKEHWYGINFESKLASFAKVILERKK